MPLLLLFLVLLGGCVHRAPAAPDALAQQCLTAQVSTALGQAVARAVEAHELPAVRIDASGCGDLRGVPVGYVVRAALTTAVSIARIGATFSEDPCVDAALVGSALWGERLGLQVADAVSSGRAVVDVPGELVVCP